MIQHAAETTEGDCDTGHAKRVFIKLTNKGAYDMVADMRISPNSALKLFAAAAPPSRLLRFSQQQRKAAAEQPAGGCFLFVEPSGDPGFLWETRCRWLI